MANIFTGDQNFKGYKTLAEIMDTTLVTGKKYLIQIQGLCYLREGTEGDGFFVSDAKPIEYIVGNDDLYLSCINSRSFTINVAEG